MRRSICLAIAIATASALSPAVHAAPAEILGTDAEADGLGTPSISIAPGTRLVGGGAGMMLQPATLHFDVPVGAAIDQVLVYWNGFHSLPGGGDAEIVIDGIDVEGQLIGGPELFFANNYSSTYRADVTSLGLVASGSNDLSIHGIDFDQVTNGVSVIAIVSESDLAAVELRDGQDLVYANFAPPLDAAVPQTFDFAPVDHPRTAELTVVAGSVQGPTSADDPVRPNELWLTVGTETTVFPYFLSSASGYEWDHVMLPFEIPAGVTFVTVELVSAPDDETTAKPSSFLWAMAGLRLPLPFCGDGITDASAGETCDDGNQVDGDGCENDCRITPRCGDGSLNSPGETCEPPGSGACRMNCTMCGDNVVQAATGETCDDGNAIDDDACGNDCRSNYCGDGEINAGEQCDDGNTIDSDLCGNDCRTNYCGDGEVNAGEQCDDGNTSDSDVCGNDCRTNYCGDGEVNAGEQCDDGNTSDSDLCGNDCRANYCGDGEVNAGEECDDGNVIEWDACGNDCRSNFCGDGQTNAGEQCDDGNSIDDDICGNDCRTNYCGDGQTNAGEQCDDGNSVDGDACSNDCRTNYCGDGQVNAGEQCDDGNAIDNDVCGNDCRTNYCGDGEVNAGEECDDGNAIDNDVCANDCWTNYCGDGEVNAGEECDDGNVIEWDACDNDCRSNFCGDGQTNAGEQCDDGNTVDSDSCGNDCLANYCGDGEVNAGEQCDDGNTVDSDSCGNDCLASYCGDGEVNAGEQCDDGNTVDSDSCGNDCLASYCGDGEVNADEQCDDGNAVDSDSCGNDCLVNYCGDGEVNAGELCDDGNTVDSDSCGNDCLANYCGDGEVNADEQCDDGNTVDSDSCGNDCLANYCGDGEANAGEQCDDGNTLDSDLCGNDCLANYCGDGEVNAGEQCDDGNTVDSDNCGNDCLANYCGDGEVNADEQCDDGNTIDSDLCGNDCLANYCGDGEANAGEQCDDGNTIDSDLCGNDCLANYCGDGEVNAGEQCDDGNTIDSDLCGNDCLANYCGDGEISAGEQCDDGNTIDSDLCGNDCLANYCGDGEVNAGEQCDDGNTLDSDLCGNDCLANYCGDGEVNAGEQCDDGNTASGDGCDASCTIEVPFCGDGTLDAGEQCDDGNSDDGDGCSRDCLIEPSCGLEIIVQPNPIVVPETTRVGCQTMGLPEQLRFRYTGDDCTGYHQQGDFAICEGRLADGEPVTILASGMSGEAEGATPYVVVPSIVAPGEMFTVYPAGEVFREELHFELEGAGLTQSIRLDTSCGRPLKNGDRFGGLTLAGYNKRNGTPAEVTFTYELTNRGAPVTDIVVENSQQGMIASGLDLAAGEFVSFSRTMSVWDSMTDPVVASGQLVGSAETCTSSDHADVFVEGRSGTCPDSFGRRPQKLALSYTGEGCSASSSDQGAIGGSWDCVGHAGYESGVRVVVADRPNLNDPEVRVWFDGSFADLGDVVLVEAAAAGANQLGPQTYVGVWKTDSRQRSLQIVRFDTSCGEILRAGDQFGSIRIESVKLAH